MKTITLQPWQLTALRAGLLKSVWVPLDRQRCQCGCHLNPGMMHIVACCEGGSMGTPGWNICGILPYAVGDVVEFVYHNRETNQFEFFRRKIAAVSIRRVDSITEQEARDAGLKDGLDAFYRQTSGQWAVKVDVEECLRC